MSDSVAATECHNSGSSTADGAMVDDNYACSTDLVMNNSTSSTIPSQSNVVKLVAKKMIRQNWTGGSEVMVMHFRVLWKDGTESWETSDKFLCDNSGSLLPFVEEFEETLTPGVGHDLVGSSIRLKIGTQQRKAMLMEWVTDDKYNIEWIAALSEQELPESLRVAQRHDLHEAPEGSWVVLEDFEDMHQPPTPPVNPGPRQRRGKLRPLLGMRIAVVDDCESSIQILVAHLCREGSVVEYFDSGTSFLHQAQRHPGRFDCVVLDYVMPGMSGLQVLDLFRKMSVPQNKPPPMVVVLSSAVEKTSDDSWCSYVPQGMQDTFSQAGADALVRKTTFACKEIIQSIVRHAMMQQAAQAEAAAAQAEAAAADDHSHP